MKIVKFAQETLWKHNHLTGQELVEWLLHEVSASEDGRLPGEFEAFQKTVGKFHKNNTNHAESSIIQGFRKWAFNEKKDIDMLGFLKEVMFFSWVKFVHMRKQERARKQAEALAAERTAEKKQMNKRFRESIVKTTISDSKVRDIVNRLTNDSHLRGQIDANGDPCSKSINNWQNRTVDVVEDLFLVLDDNRKRLLLERVTEDIERDIGEASSSDTDSDTDSDIDQATDVKNMDSDKIGFQATANCVVKKQKDKKKLNKERWKRVQRHMSMASSVQPGADISEISSSRKGSMSTAARKPRKFKLPISWSQFLASGGGYDGEKIMNSLQSEQLMTPRMLNEFICAVYLHMAKETKKSDTLAGVMRLSEDSLSCHVTSFLMMKHGSRKITLSRLGILVKSLKKHHDDNLWVVHFTDFCGIFEQLPPDALQFYLQIFSQVHALGCLKGSELLSRDGRILNQEKIYPVRVPYARKLIQVLCKTMKVSRYTSSYLSEKLLKGSYKLRIEQKNTPGQSEHIVQAIDITLVMEITLTIFFEARKLAQALSEKMMNKFDIGRSGFLEFDEFCEMMMFMNAETDIPPHKNTDQASTVKGGEKKKGIPVIGRQKSIATRLKYPRSVSPLSPQPSPGNVLSSRQHLLLSIHERALAAHIKPKLKVRTQILMT
jgi:hypothetical protein